MVTLESLEWIKVVFKTLLDTPRITTFFLEKRFEEYCLWVQKTYNRKDYIIEIYGVDDRGRRCCILVPKGTDKSGWAHFVGMISTENEMAVKDRAKTKHLEKRILLERSSSDTDSEENKRTYADVVIKGKFY